MLRGQGLPGWNRKTVGGSTMQFDDYGNVVEEPVKGIDSAQESRGKDRLTEKFLKMNEECISRLCARPTKAG